VYILKSEDEQTNSLIDDLHVSFYIYNSNTYEPLRRMLSLSVLVIPCTAYASPSYIVDSRQ